LPHVEFAYNRSLHSTTKMCPFEIVYGLLPRAPIDLMPLSSSEKLNFDAKQRADLMLKMHETTKGNIEHMYAKNKISGDKGTKQLDFEPGDLVWLHLRKERFPDLRKSKLMPTADGSFNVLEKINENAYKLDLPADFGVSPTFNIADLMPYLGEEDELESRMTQMQEGEDDVDINTNDTSTPIHNQISGPITWAHARQLNNQVSSFLASYSSNRSCIHAGDIRIPEWQQLVTASLTTYGLGFRRANTFWKAPGVYFHMHQTSRPYHVGAGHNHYFGAETFFCQRCCDTVFWPIGPCIMLSPIQMRPRVGQDRASLRSSSHTYKT
jgi:hypothetical protein